ncbi:MAG: serine protein kinase RIO [Thermoplasmata archaeon]
MGDDRSALKQLIDMDEFANRGNIDKKTLDMVFDRRTLEALRTAFFRFNIDYLDFPISSGKESVVFRAVSGKKMLAVKIYKMSTLHFMNIRKYIEGDHRFSKERLDRGNIVLLWAKKEFTNLLQVRQKKVRTPVPIGFFKNVLVMSYLGTVETPAPQLKDVNVSENTFIDVRDQMRKMYHAGIIHADLSEYNILVYRNKTYFIDMAQAVSADHPAAEEFFERDVKNISNFFEKRNINADCDDLKKYIKE